MKKIVAILLSCIMIFGYAAVSVVAADQTFGGAETITGAVIPTGDNWYITGAYQVSGTLTVSEGATLTIKDGGSLSLASAGNLIINKDAVVKVENGGRLNIAGTNATGSLIVMEGGTLEIGVTASVIVEKGSTAYNYGTITNVSKIVLNGDLYHQVSILPSFEETYSYYETYNNQTMTVTFSTSYYQPSEGDAALDYTEASSYQAISARTEVMVPHGQNLYVCITPEDGDGNWVDVGRMQLTAGGQSLTTNLIDNNRGIFCISPSNALYLDIYSTNYKDIVKLFDITLPRTEAYYVTSFEGAVDEITVEYGKTFSFRVVLSEEYDKSEPYVYVNSLFMEPDEYGYYDVTGPIVKEGMMNAGGVQENISITVMGVSANERQEMMSGIVGFIQEIFAIIQEIFSYFTDIFANLGNLGEF